MQITKADLVEEGLPVVSYGQVHAKYNTRTHLSQDLIRYVPRSYAVGNDKSLVHPHEFIVADTSEDIDGCGNMVYNDSANDVYAGYHTVILNHISFFEPKYLAYLFNSQTWRSQIRSLVNGVKVYSITKGLLKQTKVLIPKESEQRTIASYLDSATSKIDAAIAREQKMIDLLNERKQIIINQAVTKGIDQNAKMKDSGVEWIGEIPMRWQVVPLKRLLVEPMQYGANEPAENDNKSWPRYIRITDIDENGNLKDETFRSLQPEKARDYLLAKGDILFARSGATVGKTYLYNLDGQACFAGYLIRAKCNVNQLIPRYLYYYTQSGAYDNWKNSMFIKATIPNIGADKYSVLPIVVPTMSEQNRIVNWLDEVISKIDKPIMSSRKLIALLQERKQILINDVVTGKVRVS